MQVCRVFEARIDNYQLEIQSINNKKNEVYLYQFITESITIPKLELFYNNYALEHDFLTI